MAKQKAASFEDPDDTRDLNVARHGFSKSDRSGGPPPGNKPPAFQLRGESVSDCVQDPHNAISIRAAMKIVLDFVRTAKLGR